MKLRILIIHFALLSLLKAQTYNFKHYTEEDGLTQTYIYGISQSKDGALVLSTGESLTVFDGKKFFSFSYKGFSENRVTAHFLDSRGITWILFQQNGLSYFKNGVYFRFTDTLISGLKIFQIVEDNAQRLWLATSAGVFKMDTNLKITEIRLPETRQVNSIALDANQNLLLATSQGLMVVDVSDARHARVLADLENLKEVNVKQVVDADDSKLNFWVLTEGQGIYGVSAIKNKYAASYHLQPEPGAESLNIPCIYVDKAKSLWVSVFGDGLRKFSFNESGPFGNYTLKKINTLNGLGSNNIQSIYQDAEGNMWFGTFGEGLVKKPVELFAFYGRNEGIALTDVKKILKDEQGNLWMGTAKGLAVLDQANGSYHFYDASNGFVTDKVNALFMNEPGILWIGTSENGIYRYDLQHHKFENFSRKHKLLHLSVNVIAGAGDKIMAGTTDGLYVFDMDFNLEEELGTNDGLFHNNILNVFKDSKERLWICSHGTPPYYIKDQKITPFKKIEGLGFFNINAVCEDKQGNIWIATEGDGVFKYDDDHFYQYTTAKGLLSDYCVGIESDKNGAVWVTHRSGSSELKPSRERFVGFTNKRGLLFYENNLNAIYKDSEDNLWFGTTQGIVKYDALLGTDDARIPEVFISGIQLNNERYNAGELIEKKYAFYSVHIDYKAISLSDPGAIYYKYRLMDIDTNFRTTSMPYVDVPKLGDGVYTFEVIACNENTGLCSSTPARISFTIRKPVWKQAWFYFLLLCLIIVLTYVIVWLRTRSLKQTQQILEMRIDQKTFLLRREMKAVEAIKIQLEHKNKDITDSIHYAKNIQDSLLPPEETMKSLFRDDYFILFKPKDIVSGDFYWCAKRPANSGIQLALAAVIDCTGHGVPGAFLSILANDFLKQSLSEKNTDTPDQILNYLNACVSSHFNQHDGKNRIRDGMDIAMVGIDYTHNKLYYAGANNPVYVFRKSENNCVEEMIIKATKRAIGSVNEVAVNYELNCIDLVKGDMVYLFSDGYADQFGGPRNKKITYKSFRTVLMEAHHFPAYRQREYLEARLEEWKSGTEQTDDVCVLGIRI